ncbi:enoyl-CoA hydratase-related protein [Nitrincola schmidtii]|uniref:enoyl-CoA hydratase-related protein n=1 Tax=Nitrincola schmidtii TaxID=1730894 RepID=UPI00124EC503|nr:enoyl-CoA hydratase-related protein [Nitrincola schmidtii]
MSDVVLKSLSDQGVLTLTLNRPEKKNALTGAMYQILTDSLKEAEKDDAVRVVVLCGAGSDFSAGNDIHDFVSAISDPQKIRIPLGFLQAISSFTKPILAAVSGVAIGIGTSLLLHCDLVYADETAKFQLPFTKMGLVPEGGTSLLLPSALGHRKAFEILVLGDAFNAKTATDIGLINAEVPSVSLIETVTEKANQLAQMGPEAVHQSKAMMKQYDDNKLQSVLVSEVEAFAARLSSVEARATFMAFMQKGAKG